MGKPTINLNTDVYGLGSGIYFSGSVTTAISGSVGFSYYPLETCVATLKTNNITSGSSITATFAAGLTVYAQITEVTQSSGKAILYLASDNITGNF